LNLLLNALLRAVKEAAQGRDLESFRVLWKHNDKGECVVAIITSDPRLAREKLDSRYRPPKIQR
jgi:hypothetical protein